MKPIYARIPEELHKKIKESGVRIAKLLDAGHKALNTDTPILNRINELEKEIDILRRANERKYYLLNERLIKIETLNYAAAALKLNNTPSEQEQHQTSKH